MESLIIYLYLKERMKEMERGSERERERGSTQWRVIIDLYFSSLSDIKEYDIFQGKLAMQNQMT